MSSAAPASKQSTAKRAPTLWVIVAIKSLKGLAVLLLSLGVFQLTADNLPEQFQRLLQFLRLDPEKKFFVDLAARVEEISPRRLAFVAWGSAAYSAMMFIEAVGLAMRVRWIVWLVIGESAFFIPIEVLELVHHATWIILTLLFLNILIVWYLYANRTRLIKHH